MNKTLPARLVLFDGVCVLCLGAVSWLLDHDAERTLHFASLQGETGAEVIAAHPELASLDSMVFVQGSEVSVRSDAVIRIAALLPPPWSWLALARWIPRPLRDAAYRAMATSRYRLFGKHDSCRLPSDDEAARVLA